MFINVIHQCKIYFFLNIIQLFKVGVYDPAVTAAYGPQQCP